MRPATIPIPLALAALLAGCAGAGPAAPVAREAEKPPPLAGPAVSGPVPGRPAGRKGDPNGTFAGDVVTDAQIRQYAAAAGADDARRDCLEASRGGGAPGAFPLDYGGPARAWIADWARGHYGPRRAPIYLAAVAGGYAATMRSCRTREAALRRAGTSLADREAQAARIAALEESARRAERDASDRIERLEREARDSRAAAARAAAEEGVRRAMEESRRNEEERRQRRRIRELEEAARRR